MTSISKQFKWRTAQGEILTLVEMDTKHIFNSMKMCFNHLAIAHGGEPVWFQRHYGYYHNMARNNPKQLISIIVLMIHEIEARNNLPIKYWVPYSEIVRQIKPLQLHSNQKLLEASLHLVATKE